MSYVAIAGLAVSAGSAIYGGIKAGNARKKKERALLADKSENEAFYNKDYYSDYMKRADTQSLMKQTRDMLKKNNQVAANTAVVTGATPEQVAAVKEQSNKVITDTTSRVAATGQAWKDNIQQQYMNRKAQIGAQQYGEMEGAAQGYEALMGNGIRAIGSATTGLAGGLSTSGIRTDAEIAVDKKEIPSEIKTPVVGVGTPEAPNRNIPLKM